MAASTVHNTKTDTGGRRVNWLHIRCSKVGKDRPDLMCFKTDLDEDDYRTMRLTRTSKRHRPAPMKTPPLHYNSKLPISKAKQQDLLALCDCGIIPSYNHVFFTALPVSTLVTDRLSQPDVNDSGSDSD